MLIKKFNVFLFILSKFLNFSFLENMDHKQLHLTNFIVEIKLLIAISLLSYLNCIILLNS
jgi:hypothetical protein